MFERFVMSHFLLVVKALIFILFTFLPVFKSADLSDLSPLLSSENTQEEILSMVIYGGERTGLLNGTVNLASSTSQLASKMIAAETTWSFKVKTGHSRGQGLGHSKNILASRQLMGWLYERYKCVAHK